MKKNLLTALLLASALIAFSQNNQKAVKSKEISIEGLDSTKSKLMEAIEIRAVRAEKNYPFTQNLISKSSIEKNNVGQDIPFLLNQIPGAVINSDAGNGVGYTGIRIRGTDASRINFTLNGIAYNDAESQGVFLVNLPDFLSSTNSIQVQRGVGTSSNGAGAFGATVNLMTNEVQEKAYASINNSIGSFNTLKNTLKVGTGLLNGKYTIDARLSNISSDGYIDRASSKLQSFYVSAASIREKSSLRLNVFSGKEKTYQAWYGVTEEQLSTNRRYNSAGTEKPGNPYDNETDNYTQTHYQLFYNQRINSNWNFSGAAFATTGNGYYEQYKANQSFGSYGLPNYQIRVGNTITETDLIRQLWLDNVYMGTNFSFQRKTKNNELILGGGNSTYNGNHFGKIIWAGTGIEKDYRWYDLDAKKQEQHLFGKWLHKYNDFHFFGDIQARNVNYNIEGFRNNPGLKIDQKWLFINPKIGFRYSKNNNSVFASFAIANKEPNRDDFEASITEQPRREQLIDWETGFEFKKPKYAINANIYYMDYKDQLVLTGKINDVGAYTRINVPKSYRAGLELQFKYALNKKYNTSYSITFSQNKIEEFTEYIDDYDEFTQVAIQHKNTNIALSPSLTTNRTFNWRPNDMLSFFWTTKYTSKQFLDNTQNKDRQLDAYFINDINAHWTILNKTKFTMLLQVYANNLLDVKYAPNGYTYSYIYDGSLTTSNNYYPMAGRNFWVSLKIDLK
jgi:iron complex outermembrane receptor protein